MNSPVTLKDLRIAIDRRLYQVNKNLQIATGRDTSVWMNLPEYEAVVSKLNSHDLVIIQSVVEACALAAVMEYLQSRTGRLA